jgi:hypothetical protein
MIADDQHVEPRLMLCVGSRKEFCSVVYNLQYELHPERAVRLRWLSQAVEFVRDRSGLVVFAPFWLVLLAPMAWLLAWITVGRWVFQTAGGELIVDRRLATISFWRTAYPIDSIGGFRVEEQRRKIKGNTSLRYPVLMDRVNGTREVAWYRRRTDAETLANQLLVLTRQSRAEG